MRSVAWWLAPVTALALGACTAPAAGRSTPGVGAAPVLHVVLFQLLEPQRALELAADCDELLAPIPTVVSYAVGRHLDIGREHIDADYDLALLVGFANASGYRTYLEHTDHLLLVQRWRPHFRGLRILDLDVNPTGTPALPR